MYVTRRLSMYKNSPGALSMPPPEGPFSGYLVLHDEEAQNFRCLGMCKDDKLYGLPFPQNMDLTIRYAETSGDSPSNNPVVLIPVPGQPLSSNRYYVIQRRGKRKGEAHTTSTEEQKCTCLCFRYVRDNKPTPLDPTNIKQQFEIYPHKETCCSFEGFSANAVLPHGYPPRFLRRKGWWIYAKTPKTYSLEEAEGVNPSLRRRLPSFDFSADKKVSDRVVVGKWYCPFMFVKDGNVSDQMKSSRYYKMTLEQEWERVFSIENNRAGWGNSRVVVVDVEVQSEAVSVGLRGKGLRRPGYVVDGVMWFEGEGERVGLSEGIVQRMRWEEERVGWVEGGEVMRLRKEEEFGNKSDGWVRFGYYVLVERFVLERMNGSFVLLLSYEFRHIRQARTKWDSM